MNRFRFSLLSFLAVVTLLALGLAAMTSQSRVAASASLTVFLSLLCLALGGALVPQARNRPFWIGLAVFGWTYWFVEFDASQPSGGQIPTSATFALLSGRVVSQPSGSPRVGLITGDLIELLETSTSPQRRVGSKVMAQWRGGSYYSGTIAEAQDGQYLIVWDDGSAQQWTSASQILPHSPSLRVAAHALLGGLFALAGGCLVALLFGLKQPLAETIPKPGGDESKP